MELVRAPSETFTSTSHPDRVENQLVTDRSASEPSGVYLSETLGRDRNMQNIGRRNGTVRFMRQIMERTNSKAQERKTKELEKRNSIREFFEEQGQSVENTPNYLHLPIAIARRGDLEQNNSSDRICSNDIVAHSNEGDSKYKGESFYEAMSRRLQYIQNNDAYQNTEDKEASSRKQDHLPLKSEKSVVADREHLPIIGGSGSLVQQLLRKKQELEYEKESLHLSQQRINEIEQELRWYHAHIHTEEAKDKTTIPSRQLNKVELNARLNASSMLGIHQEPLHDSHSIGFSKLDRRLPSERKYFSRIPDQPYPSTEPSSGIRHATFGKNYIEYQNQSPAVGINNSQLNSQVIDNEMAMTEGRMGKLRKETNQYDTGNESWKNMIEVKKLQREIKKEHTLRKLRYTLAKERSARRRAEIEDELQKERFHEKLLTQPTLDEERFNIPAFERKIRRQTIQQARCPNCGWKNRNSVDPRNTNYSTKSEDLGIGRVIRQLEEELYRLKMLHNYTQEYKTNQTLKSRSKLKSSLLVEELEDLVDRIEKKMEQIIILHDFRSSISVSHPKKSHLAEQFNKHEVL
ncbi:uncharacterized protein VTP21DRAFT_11556 [Calcarisporiella thermophila]|uniref:uncharacterized protein n=1 Tax=Calcarisporiella thermophila TaxID=911321 RepID=UPI003742C73D